MTDTVVTQSGQTSVVQEQRVQQVIVEDKSPTIITSPITVPPTVNSLGLSTDVDITQLQNGNVLVYNSTTNKWTATNLLENQIFESGQY